MSELEVNPSIKREFVLENLGCANCAAKMENKIEKIQGVKTASINFATKTLYMEVDKVRDIEKIIEETKSIITDIEAHVVLKEKGTAAAVKKVVILENLCCANCAAKIEKAAKALPEVEDASLDFVSKKLFVKIENSSATSKVIDDIKDIVASIEPDVQVKLEDKAIKDTVKDEHSQKIGKLEMIQFILGIAFFISALALNLHGATKVVIFLVSYILIGGEVLVKAVRNIIKGQVFDENFLMCLATVGAFAIKEYPEAVAVMLFYKVGEFFQDLAVDRSRRSIEALMDIRPDYANMKSGNNIVTVNPEEVTVGDVIIVKPGEKVPLDGRVIEGSSMIDTSALTGESVPREVTIGDTVLSGFINKNGLLSIEVTKNYEESTVSKILDLVQNANSKKAPTENFITKFAYYYTPIVVFSALALAFIPPIFVGNLSQWLSRALVFLVVSCPCALVISIPLGFFGGIGGASKQGILVKGGNYLEALNSVEMVVFDKTGTLTKGIFEVSEVRGTNGYSNDEILESAAFSESYSSHPIATSIMKSYGKDIDQDSISEYEEVAGQGVKACFGEKKVLCGNKKLMENNNIKYEDVNAAGTVVHVAIDGTYAGFIVISDKIKSDSKIAVERLKKLGIKRTVMLTGDNSKTANQIAGEIGIDDIYSELLPQEKVERVEELYNSKSEKGKIVFVGDGINDAPVLARADIGIAMGGIGSDAAIEAADIVIMTDEPSKIVDAIKIAKKTRKIVMQNIVFALGIKGIILILGVFGIATMWEAVFGDVGVALIAVLNSMRVLTGSNK